MQNAIVISEWTTPNKLTVSKVPIPEVTNETLLIRVKACGCNFFDILMVQGKYQLKPPHPFILGAEFSGVIEQVGKNVSGFAPGDRVLGFLPFGAYAEIINVAPLFVKKIPDNMNFDSAAGFGMAYGTSYGALVYRADLKKGEKLLVHGGAGSVSIAAIQIGKVLGAYVIATASSDEKLQIAKDAGADAVVNYKNEDWVTKVKELTDGKGVDVIYDPVGGDVFDNSIKCLAWCGRLLVIGFAGGRISKVETNRILLKNISIVGLQWGAYLTNDPDKYEDCFKELFKLYAEGKLNPIIYKKVYTLEELPIALKEIDSRKAYGKVIVIPNLKPSSKL